jgi:hypothetical protein
MRHRFKSRLIAAPPRGVFEAVASMPTGFETIDGAAFAARGHDMPTRTNTSQTDSDESPQAMRERQSAQQVAEWEAAFRAAKRSGGPPDAARPQPTGS